jgi:outer membrane protein TolC
MGRIPGAAAIAAVVILALLCPVPARAESLADSWAIALRVNQGLSAQQSESVAAGFDLAAARSARGPTVRSQNYNVLLSNTPGVKSPLSSTSSGSSSALSGLPAYFHILGPNQTDLPLSFTFATLPLYTGGRLMRNIDAAAEAVTQQRTQEFRTALDLKLTVAEAYVSVLRARRSLEVAQSNVTTLASFARDTTNRRVQGLAIRSDELAAEVSLANAQLSEIQARNALETAWATYNRYLCRPLGTVVELEELEAVPANADWSDLARRAIRANAEFSALSEPEVSAMTDQAFRIRPELAGLTAEARALDAQAESTLSNIRPQVNASGGFVFVGAQTSAPQGIGVAMVSLNWNLTDSGASRRRAAGIRERERATLKQRADLAADVALQVRTRWLDLRQARLSVPVARFAVVQAEENIKVVTDRYRQQLSTYTEVLDAETRRVQSLNRFYNALYDESLALFRLRRAVGDL